MLFQSKQGGPNDIYKKILRGENQKLRISVMMSIVINLRLVLPILVLVFASTQSMSPLLPEDYKFHLNLPPVTVRIVTVRRRKPFLRLGPSVYSS